MFTVSNIEYTTIVNKSKFITNIIFVNNVEEVDMYLENIKKKYKDATHHCYAYIIDNIKRFSDDNEPNGTAGMPILDCLEKNNLNHVLCIVTRYFGGIKLGAGGLLRAYSNSVSNALNNTNKLKLINGFEAIISFEYNKTKEIDKILETYEIKNKIFDKEVIYDAFIDNEVIDKIKDITKIEIKKEIIIKRKI